MFADHAEVSACSLFGSIRTLLEVDHLGIQCGIALTERIIEGALIGHGCAQLQGLAIAVVGEPEFGLKAEPGNRESCE